MFINDLRAYSRTKPFFLWFAPGACHAPHQAPRSYIDPTGAPFDLGWDAWREQVFARQVGPGCSRPGTELSSERPQLGPGLVYAARRTRDASTRA